MMNEQLTKINKEKEGVKTIGAYECYIGIPEMAAIYGISQRKMREICADIESPAIKPGGRTAKWKARLSEMDKYMQKKKQELYK